jgi:hypothetical protein
MTSVMAKLGQGGCEYHSDDAGINLHACEVDWMDMGMHGRNFGGQVVQLVGNSPKQQEKHYDSNGQHARGAMTSCDTCMQL